ncbi:hypothetical protein HBB16_13550 [Pseudonocardia sp. MCCB 268]|nr:hypothetical protein [Pseudonocardia cytotoxica]
MKYDAWVAWMGRRRRDGPTARHDGDPQDRRTVFAWLMGVFDTVGGWVELDWPVAPGSPLKHLMGATRFPPHGPPR